jgi:hypothetical protein
MFPPLQLDDIPFRVSDIGKGDPPSSCYSSCNDLANRSATSQEDGLARSTHVVYGQGKVSPARPIRRGLLVFPLRRVLKDL